MRRPVLALVLVQPWVGGCPEAGCVEVVEPCTPQYQPTFDAVWTNTLSTSCALSGCHGGTSAAGGLSMGASADEAFEALGGGFIEPGDPACSPLVARIEPTGVGDMPPGATLSDEERCAVRTWIAEGAVR